MLVGCRVYISQDLWTQDGMKLLNYIEKVYTSDYKLIFAKHNVLPANIPVAIDFKSPDIAREVFTLLTLTELKSIYENES